MLCVCVVAFGNKQLSRVPFLPSEAWCAISYVRPSWLLCTVIVRPSHTVRVHFASAQWSDRVMKIRWVHAGACDVILTRRALRSIVKVAPVIMMGRIHKLNYALQALKLKCGATRTHESPDFSLSIANPVLQLFDFHTVPFLTSRINPTWIYRKYQVSLPMHVSKSR